MIIECSTLILPLSIVNFGKLHKILRFLTTLFTILLLFGFHCLFVYLSISFANMKLYSECSVDYRIPLDPNDSLLLNGAGDFGAKFDGMR